MTDKQESGDGSLAGENVGSVQGWLSPRQLTDALDRLRSVVDQTSQMLRDFGQTSGEWTQAAQNRASDMARHLRNQGGIAVDSVSRQVERNPLASVAIAFAVGFACAAVATTLIRR